MINSAARTSSVEFNFEKRGREEPAAARGKHCFHRVGARTDYTTSSSLKPHYWKFPYGLERIELRECTRARVVEEEEETRPHHDSPPVPRELWISVPSSFPSLPLVHTDAEAFNRARVLSWLTIAVSLSLVSCFNFGTRLNRVSTLFASFP